MCRRNQGNLATKDILTALGFLLRRPTSTKAAIERVHERFHTMVRDQEENMGLTHAEALVKIGHEPGPLR